MDSGLGFLASLLTVLGALLLFAALAAALSGLDGDRKGMHRSRLAAWLSDLWRAAGDRGWAKAAACGIGHGVAAADRAISAFFEDADRTPAMGIVFLGLLFVMIPLAALVNFAFGGSANLALIYLAVAVALAGLVLFGQIGSRNGAGAILNGLLSLCVFTAVMAIVPWYVVVSFTERISFENLGRAFLMSLLIVPFYYVAAYSAMLCLEAVAPGMGPTAKRRPAVVFVRRFLAALPLAFIGLFLAMLFGQWAVGYEAAAKPLGLLFIAIVLGALAVPVSMALFEATAKRGAGVTLLIALPVGIALSAALGLAFPAAAGGAGGGTMIFGRNFWIKLLPMLPVIGLFALALSGIAAMAIARAGQALFRRPLAAERPFLASAMLFAAWGGVLITAGRAISWLA